MSTSIRLSYSSMKELQSCEQKYFHRKVASTPVDSDYQESDALGVGKAFHKVLEDNMHEKYNKEEVIKACEEFNVVDDIPMVEAMISKYVDYHLLSDIKIVKCELQIVDSVFNGFIDAIGVDSTKKWWIIDLKTSARFDESLLPRLPKDPQLNLYAKYADIIESHLPELKDHTFGGCRYRVATKTKSVSQDILKLKHAIKVFDVVIDADSLDIKTNYGIFLDQHDVATRIHSGEAPKKNYNACLDYFKPCAYFSKCHGHLFSEGKSKVTVHTIESLTEEGDLL